MKAPVELIVRPTTFGKVIIWYDRTGFGATAYDHEGCIAGEYYHPLLSEVAKWAERWGFSL